MVVNIPHSVGYGSCPYIKLVTTSTAVRCPASPTCPRRLLVMSVTPQSRSRWSVRLSAAFSGYHRRGGLETGTHAEQMQRAIVLDRALIRLLSLTNTMGASSRVTDTQLRISYMPDHPLCCWLMQMTLSPNHYAYGAPEKGAPFGARMATPGRDIKVHSSHPCAILTTA